MNIFRQPGLVAAKGRVKIMVFQRKKLSPIERRLEELHKEMTRVNRDLKTVSRVGPGPVALGAPGARLPMFPESPAPVPAPVEPPPVVPGLTGIEPAVGDLFAHAAKTAVASDKPVDLFPGLPAKGASQVRPATPASPHDPRSGRERFAHYFMAGHFQNLRPSRQESRVIRNKAIIMLIVASALLAWLLFYLRSH